MTNTKKYSNKELIEIINAVSMMITENNDNYEEWFDNFLKENNITMAKYVKEHIKDVIFAINR